MPAKIISCPFFYFGYVLFFFYPHRRYDGYLILQAGVLSYTFSKSLYWD